MTAVATGGWSQQPANSGRRCRRSAATTASSPSARSARRARSSTRAGRRRGVPRLARRPGAATMAPRPGGARSSRGPFVAAGPYDGRREIGSRRSREGCGSQPGTAGRSIAPRRCSTRPTCPACWARRRRRSFCMRTVPSLAGGQAAEPGAFGASAGRSGELRDELRVERLETTGSASRAGSCGPNRGWELQDAPVLLPAEALHRGAGRGRPQGRARVRRSGRVATIEDVPLALVTGPANAAKAGEVLGGLRARLDEEPILVVPAFAGRRARPARAGRARRRVRRARAALRLAVPRDGPPGGRAASGVASDVPARADRRGGGPARAARAARRVGCPAGLRARRGALRRRAGRARWWSRRASPRRCAPGRRTARAGPTRRRSPRSTAATATGSRAPGWWTPSCSPGARSTRCAATRPPGATRPSSSTASTTSPRSSSTRSRRSPTAATST